MTQFKFIAKHSGLVTQLKIKIIYAIFRCYIDSRDFQIFLCQTGKQFFCSTSKYLGVNMAYVLKFHIKTCIFCFKFVFSVVDFPLR